MLVDTDVPLLLRGGRAADLERAAARLHTASRPGRRLVRLDGRTTGRERAALQRISVDVAWDDAGNGSVVVADLFRLAMPVQQRLAELVVSGRIAAPRLIGLLVDDHRAGPSRAARALLDSLLLIDLPPAPARDPMIADALVAVERGESVDLQRLGRRAARGAEAVVVAHAVRQSGGDEALAARRLGIDRERLDRMLAVRDESPVAAERKTFSSRAERAFPVAAPEPVRRREEPSDEIS